MFPPQAGQWGDMVREMCFKALVHVKKYLLGTYHIHAEIYQQLT